MMKLVIDERVKHRLIGLAVILSIGAIFAPAIMKKSSQRLDGNVSVSVELPPKPLQPDVALTDKKLMFENVKVAHVELPDRSEEQVFTKVARAEPLSQMNNAQLKSVEPVDETFAQNSDLIREQSPLDSKTKVAMIQKIAQGVQFSQTPKPAVLVKNANIAKPVAKVISKPLASSAIKRSNYSVQLATFTQQRNADYLISKLKDKGYTGTYTKIKTQNGVVYRVLVGQVNNKEQALLLQKQLASALQIKGFVVTTAQA